MHKLSVAQRAYIAGFLDGDGSIYVRLKPNKTYRYLYQVAPNVVFFQSKKERRGLEYMQRITGVGYLRDRNDGVVEYTIGDVASIASLLKAIYPYLYLKKRQADLILRILGKKQLVKTAAQFIELASLIDKFQQLNYSKRRMHMSASVKSTLKAKGLLTP
jgi:intein-encoded DNA endonuclease-like protein